MAIQGFAAAGRPSVLLTDRGVAEAQQEFLANAFADIPRLVVGMGEAAKSLEVFGQVLEFLAQHRITRQGLLWVVGGGVTGVGVGVEADPVGILDPGKRRRRANTLL